MGPEYVIAACLQRRGNALPETALVVSLLLMLTLAAIDLATIGYSQAQADGAAFVGARTLAVQNSTSQTVADTAIAGVFPKVQPNTVVIKTTTGSYVGAQVSLPGQAIHLLNGLSGPSTQVGHTYETTLGSANPLPATLSVVSDVPCAVIILDNNAPSVYTSIRVAQDATPTNPGANGSNLNFGEFSVHQSTYANLSLGNTPVFPDGVSLATATINLAADLARSNGTENTMTKWDTAGLSAGNSTYPAADQTCKPVTH